MIACGSRLRAGRLLVATQGNISLRLPGGNFLITASGVDKGELTPADILRISSNGRRIAPDGSTLTSKGVPSSETALHLAAYRRWPETGAVIHAHPPAASAFALARRPLPRGVTAEAEAELGEVQLLPWAPPGSDALAATLWEAPADGCAFLLSNHGTLTLGAHLEQACRRMELLEHYAATLLLAGRLGEAVPLSASELALLRKQSEV